MNNNQGRKRVRRARKNNANVSRILLMIGMMALVAVVSIGGTIAWLTDTTSTVTNTFTESDIDIELTETDNEDEGDDALNNIYKMVPGVDIAKDPKVTYLAGNEAGWLFVKVEKNDTVDTYLTYTINTQWTALDEDKYPGVYYIQHNDTLTTGDAVYSVLVGDKVTVNTGVTKANMDDLAEGKAEKPELKFTAYAIQQAGFATAELAWLEVSK